jgi:hypothetical protein
VPAIRSIKDKSPDESQHLKEATVPAPSSPKKIYAGGLDESDFWARRYEKMKNPFG